MRATPSLPLNIPGRDLAIARSPISRLDDVTLGKTLTALDAHQLELELERELELELELERELELEAVQVADECARSNAIRAWRQTVRGTSSRWPTLESLAFLERH